MTRHVLILRFYFGINGGLLLETIVTHNLWRRVHGLHMKARLLIRGALAHFRLATIVFRHIIAILFHLLFARLAELVRACHVLNKVEIGHCLLTTVTLGNLEMPLVNFGRHMLYFLLVRYKIATEKILLSDNTQKEGRLHFLLQILVGLDEIQLVHQSVGNLVLLVSSYPRVF